MVILNLPWSDHFKLHSVILAGLIPGPNKPADDINTFLFPLVDDLKALSRCLLSTYFALFVSDNNHESCGLVPNGDLPATRKACGLASYNALHECFKCLKQFPTEAFGEKPHYSGNDWVRS